MAGTLDLSIQISRNTKESELTIENILLIWPTLHSLARSLSAGDVISLSRASRSLRSILHGFDHLVPTPLNLGYHETSQWALLKSVAPFTCVSGTHKDPKSVSSSSDHSRKSQHPIRPCNFCSRPICRTCIVRSFFADPTQSRNTFKHRTRYLCTKCWDRGNLRKDFRYPLYASTSSREHIWHGQNYSLRGQRCTCSASEDNWLCHPCRGLQNEGGPLNVSFFDISSSEDKNEKGKSKSRMDASQTLQATEVPCYGLNCENTISLTDSSRDRRRICLWCSRPLPRPYGGEDRIRWEEKQIAIRNANAASRSADIAEWARNRFKSLTTSRRDIRGSEVSDSDDTIFVKHLDAVNYRALVGEAAAPTPEDVYNSKQGRWRYKRAFLANAAFYERHPNDPEGILRSDFDRNALGSNDVTPEQLLAITSEGALSNARPNKEVLFRINGAPRGRLDPWDEWPSTAIQRLAVQFLNAGLMTEQEFQNLVASKYEVRKQQTWKDILIRMYDQLMIYETTCDEDVAPRNTAEIFGGIIKDYGITLRTNEAEAKVRTQNLADEQPGPSTAPRSDSTEDTAPENPQSPTSQGEDVSWQVVPPPGSPPSFATAVSGGTFPT